MKFIGLWNRHPLNGVWTIFGELRVHFTRKCFNRDKMLKKLEWRTVYFFKQSSNYLWNFDKRLFKTRPTRWIKKKKKKRLYEFFFSCVTFSNADINHRQIDANEPENNYRTRRVLRCTLKLQNVPLCITYLWIINSIPLKFIASNLALYCVDFGLIIQYFINESNLKSFIIILN